jgi:hypothetical protein
MSDNAMAPDLLAENKELKEEIELLRLTVVSMSTELSQLKLQIKLENWRKNNV